MLRSWASIHHHHHRKSWNLRHFALSMNSSTCLSVLKGTEGCGEWKVNNAILAPASQPCGQWEWEDVHEALMRTANSYPNNVVHSQSASIPVLQRMIKSQVTQQLLQGSAYLSTYMITETLPTLWAWKARKSRTPSSSTCEACVRCALTVWPSRSTSRLFR